VVSKEKAPTWYVPDSIRKEHAKNGDLLPAAVPPGPKNPLGSHVLRLALPSYLIHGTNKPYGIGMRVSHGCIQLYPEDIAVLYQRIPVGTPVRIVNQPFLAGWQDGTLYLETHEPLEDDKRNRRKALRNLLQTKLQTKAAENAVPLEIDWEKVSHLAAKPRGLPVPVTVGAPGLEEILASAPLVGNTLPGGSNYARQKLKTPPSHKPSVSQTVAEVSPNHES
jgi:L,D-transpeptidase ErfK/SrfK